MYKQVSGLSTTPSGHTLAKPVGEYGARANLNWTFLSPSYVFQSGERTGKFRLGKDDLPVNDQGSSISFEDFAVALADEIETPRHSRQRFTVGY
jgi:putative NADH-flavin reductase